MLAYGWTHEPEAERYCELLEKDKAVRQIGEGFEGQVEAWNFILQTVGSYLGILSRSRVIFLELCLESIIRCQNEENLDVNKLGIHNNNPREQS